jgi:hypothetical protein
MRAGRSGRWPQASGLPRRCMRHRAPIDPDAHARGSRKRPRDCARDAQRGLEARGGPGTTHAGRRAPRAAGRHGGSNAARMHGAWCPRLGTGSWSCPCAAVCAPAPHKSGEDSALARSNIPHAQAGRKAFPAVRAETGAPRVCAIRPVGPRGTAHKKRLTRGAVGIPGARRDGDQRVHAHSDRL